MSVGRTDGADFRLLPKIRTIADSRTSRSPSDAASLASGAVFRSGRKIASSMRTPNTAMEATVRTNAGADESSKPKKPVLSAQKKYAATIAIAPVATLITPDPR